MNQGCFEYLQLENIPIDGIPTSYPKFFQSSTYLCIGHPICPNVQSLVTLQSRECFDGYEKGMIYTGSMK